MDGRIIDERYRLETLVAEGAMGAVWRAEHLTLGAPVAVKLIHAEAARHADALARFEREAKIAARLRSQHVVHVLDHGRDQDQPYMVMEWLDGESLAQRLKRRGRLSLSDTVQVVSHVALALHKAHEAALVHRDVKPGNIFAARSDREAGEVYKVLDFGVAKITDNMAFVTELCTKTGAVIGTPHYLSPEQAQGLKTVDHRADLWSLGVVCFECLTGAPPFRAKALGPLVAKILQGPIPVPSEVAPDAAILAEVDDWLRQALCRDPAGRFSSARQMAEALRIAAGVAAGEAPVERGAPIVHPAAPAMDDEYDGGSTELLVDGLPEDEASSNAATIAVEGAESNASTIAVEGAESNASTIAVEGAESNASTIAVEGAESNASTIAVEGAEAIAATVAVQGAESNAATVAVESDLDHGGGPPASPRGADPPAAHRQPSTAAGAAVHAAAAPRPATPSAVDAPPRGARRGLLWIGAAAGVVLLLAGSWWAVGGSGSGADGSSSADQAGLASDEPSAASSAPDESAPDPAEPTASAGGQTAPIASTAATAQPMATGAVPPGATRPAGCRRSSDCPGQQSCQSGRCAPVPAGGCRSDSDCKGSRVCRGGRCVSPGCLSNADCKGGRLCVGGTCTAAVRCNGRDSDCPGSAVCVQGTCRSR